MSMKSSLFLLFTAAGIGLLTYSYPAALGLQSEGDSVLLSSSSPSRDEHRGGDAALSVIWSVSTEVKTELKVLKSWSLSDLHQFKSTASYEKDPQTGKVTAWKGVLLSKIVEDVISPLSPEDRAHFDLVILRGRSGQSAAIPRALIVKYPILLANMESHSARGPLYTVVPWTSRPRIMNEDLPIESFFVPQVTRIELANYASRYGALFLKRRTDPLAIRGEKIFVQGCASCHTYRNDSRSLDVAAEERAQRYLAGNHPSIKGLIHLSETSRRSIARYLDAFRLESVLNPSLSSVRSAQVSGQPGNEAVPASVH